MSPIADAAGELDLLPLREHFHLDPVALHAGSAEIVRARDKATGKTVGVQRLRSEHAGDPALRRAFVHSCSSASGAFHSNVLQPMVLARDQDQSVYGIVEWPAGGSLGDRVEREGPLAWEDARRAGLAAAEALVFLARRGLSHPDLQPDHLLVMADGTVRLFGFEPAQGAHDAARDAERLCRVIVRLATGAERSSAELPEDAPAWVRVLVERASAADPAQRWLHPEEVRGFLQEEGRAAGSASVDVTRPDADPPPREESSAAEFPWRPLASQYEIQGEPLEGGMGSVFRAVEKVTGRSVAIKRVQERFAGDERARLRFQREARNIARLNHPNILQLYQLGRDASGDYLVLEWAPGGSLSDRVRAEGALPEDELVRLLRSVAAALAYAHEKGCIHRDVKPGNILIGENGAPKLADFGLARSEADATLTGSGGAGSPLYMAPEQWGGGQVDARTDIYGLGKTLYHLATGSKPGTIEAARIPRRLRALVLRAIEEDPARRFASARELVAALDAPPALARRRWILAGVLALLLAASGAVVWWAAAQRAAAGPMRVAEAPAPTPALPPEEASPPGDDGQQATDRIHDPEVEPADPPPREATSAPVVVPPLPEPEARTESPPSIASAVADEPDPSPSDPKADAGDEPHPPRSDPGADPTPASNDTEIQQPVESDPRVAPDLPKVPASEPDVPAPPPGPAPDDAWLEQLPLAWRDAARTIADPARCPAYGALHIRPQPGLRPLRRDPGSRLYEFLVEGTGQAPTWQGDGPMYLAADTGIVLVLLPGGAFVMGDPAGNEDEQPAHRVVLDPFLMAKFELTQWQWQHLAGVNPSTFRSGQRVMEQAFNPRHPVESVTQRECEALLRRIGLTLPTEAQWEYAARAGTSGSWSSGAAANTLRHRANLADQTARAKREARRFRLGRDEDAWDWVEYWAGWADGFVHHAPVGMFDPNPFGLYDMHGNVWEWCLDPYGPYTSAVAAGHGARAGSDPRRVLRGGAFDNDAHFARSAKRNGREPDLRSFSAGCRAARPLEPR